MRTTLDLEKPVLDGLKRLQKTEKATLGEIASRLLAEALRNYETREKSAAKLDWISCDMRAKINLADKDVLYRTLDDAG